MRIVIIYLFLLATFMCNVPANAQADYLPGQIVTLEGDTIPGFIEYHEWSVTPESIRFKMNKTSDYVEHSPLTINAFIVANYVYRSMEVNVTEMHRSTATMDYNNIPFSEKKQQFLLLVIESNISLYQTFDNLDIDRYYIDTPESEIDELIYFKYYITVKGDRSIATNEKYKGQLIYHLRQCEGIDKEIQKTDYNVNELVNLIEYYTKCTSNTIVYKHEFSVSNEIKTKRVKSRIKIGLFAGGSLTNVKFTGADDDYFYIYDMDFKNSLRPTFGLLLNIEPGKARGRWSILLDLLVRSYKIESESMYDYSTEDFTATEKYNLTLANTFLTFTPMWRYYFSKSDLKPYLNAGLFLGIKIHDIDELIIEEDKYGTVTTKTTNAFDYVKNPPVDFGPMLGGGIKYKKWYLDLRYSYSLTSMWPVTTKVNALMFMLGFSFN